MEYRSVVDLYTGTVCPIYTDTLHRFLTKRKPFPMWVETVNSENLRVIFDKLGVWGIREGGGEGSEWVAGNLN